MSNYPSGEPSVEKQTVEYFCEECDEPYLVVGRVELGHFSPCEEDGDLCPTCGGIPNSDGVVEADDPEDQDDGSIDDDPDDPDDTIDLPPLEEPRVGIYFGSVMLILFVIFCWWLVVKMIGM